MAELKGVAWACASLNASACASYSPRLYVTTKEGQPSARCRTRPVARKSLERLHALPRNKGTSSIEEVTEHPLLQLLAMPTPMGVSFNAYDLWEVSQLYLEVHGRGFWYLERDALGTPYEIWLLPPQNMTPLREQDSPRVVDRWRYRVGAKEQLFGPEDIVFFHYSDPRDPYLGGMGPLRAAYEQVTATSHYAARKLAVFENDAIPSALISPDEALGEEEAARLEIQWNQRLRRGGAGKVLVSTDRMNVNLLSHSLGDLALLAEVSATKEDICNAFHVPISYFTTHTNLANLQASRAQHMEQAIAPRLARRD
jgi:HK97 family phage portal protein